MKIAYGGSGSVLHLAALAARILMRTLEFRHEQLIRKGDFGALAGLGRTYADAAHQYLQAAMEWLIWIDSNYKHWKSGSDDRRAPQCSQRAALMAEWAKLVRLQYRAARHLQSRSGYHEDFESALEVIRYLGANVEEAHKRLALHRERHGC